MCIRDRAGAAACGVSVCLGLEVSRPLKGRASRAFAFWVLGRSAAAGLSLTRRGQRCWAGKAAAGLGSVDVKQAVCVLGYQALAGSEKDRLSVRGCLDEVGVIGALAGRDEKQTALVYLEVVGV